MNYRCEGQPSVCRLGFTKGFGGEGAQSAGGIALGSDQAVYVVGGFNGGAASVGGTTTLESRGGNDAYIASYKADGSFLRVLQLGGAGNEGAGKIVLDADDNLYVTGSTTSPDFKYDEVHEAPGGGGWIVSFDPAGVFRWAHNYPGAVELRDLALDPTNGNVVVVGATQGSVDLGMPVGTVNKSGAGYDLFMASYKASSGTPNWGFIPPGEGDEGAQSVGVDNSGNIFISGSTAQTLNLGDGALVPAFPGSSHVIVASFGVDGSIRWSMIAAATRPPGSEPALSNPSGVAVDRNNNVLLVSAGFRGGFKLGAETVENPASHLHGALVLLDTFDGAFKAQRIIPATGAVNLYTVGFDPAGNSFVAGTIDGAPNYGGGSAGGGAFVASYTRDDLSFRNAVSGSNSYTTVNALAVHPNGGVFMAGNQDRGIVDWGFGLVENPVNVDVWLAYVPPPF